MDNDASAVNDTYLVGHLHEALVADSRLHEQGLEIVVVSMRRIAIHGEVATAARRDAERGPARPQGRPRFLLLRLTFHRNPESLGNGGDERALNEHREEDDDEESTGEDSD